VLKLRTVAIRSPLATYNREEYPDRKNPNTVTKSELMAKIHKRQRMLCIELVPAVEAAGVSQSSSTSHVLGRGKCREL
jgi:hypothetical protein